MSLINKKSSPSDETKNKLKLIPVDNIIPNRNQPRKHFDKKEMEDLAESIDVNGLLQPIIVRRLEEPAENGEEFELIAGERRWRAHIALDKARIEAIITEHDDRESAILALIENMQRSDLTSIEEANALKNIMDESGYTQEELARHVGKSRSQVANLLRLLKLPEEVKAQIARKQIDQSQAFALAGLKDKKGQVELALKCVEKDWSVLELKKHIDKRNGKEEAKKLDKEEGEEPTNEGPKHPIPNNYILVRVDDAEALEDALSALAEATGYTVFLNEEIRAEIRRATSPLVKVNEERKAAKEKEVVAPEKPKLSKRA